LIKTYISLWESCRSIAPLQLLVLEIFEYVDTFWSFIISKTGSRNWNGRRRRELSARARAPAFFAATCCAAQSPVYGCLCASVVDQVATVGRPPRRFAVSRAQERVERSRVLLATRRCAPCRTAFLRMQASHLAAPWLKATVASPSSASFGVNNKNAGAAPLFARRRPPLLLSAALPRSCRGVLSAHNQRRPTLSSPSSSSPAPLSAPQHRRWAAGQCRRRRHGCSGRYQAVPVQAPDEAASGPTFTNNWSRVSPQSFLASSSVHPGDELAGFWISPPTGAPRDYIASPSFFPGRFP
jgi:hypothetical protein